MEDLIAKNPGGCIEIYLILRENKSHFLNFLGFTFREYENKCNVNRSNYAFIFNLKLSIVPQHSKQKCCLVEDAYSIGKVHQRRAFCFGSHGGLTVFLLLLKDSSVAARDARFIFFEQK